VNLIDKIQKGNDYLINQCEAKLNSLGALEKGKFTPTNPKAYNRYKKEAEFRLRYVEAVSELLKQHVLLSEGLLEFINKIDNEGNIEEEEINGLRKFAEKYK